MEYYQQTQNRAAQTVAVINQFAPGMKIGTTTAANLLSTSEELAEIAQQRDDALAALDAATNAENFGYLTLRRLTLSLPQSAEGELNDEVEPESALLDLLDPVYAIVPRTTEAALERGRKLFSALTRMNTFLAAKTPPLPPITSGGKGISQLLTAIEAQPALEQAVEDRAAAVRATRLALRNSAAGVDRLNKRFYSKLQGEARENPELAEALGQIDTGDTRPGTLGILKVLQGGVNQLQLLVSYENGSFEDNATNTLEWMVQGVDAEFSKSQPVDPSGNALGPFTAGQTVALRTRVTTATGTTTGSVRTLTIQAPPA